jgi:hypothetical protein
MIASLELQPGYIAGSMLIDTGHLAHAGVHLCDLQAELTAVRAVSAQLDKFRTEMERDASAQRDALLKVGSVKRK